MRKVFVFFLSLLLFSCGAFVSFGQDACAPCEEVGCEPCDAVSCEPCDPCTVFKKSYRHKSLFDSIDVYGWLEAGVYTNSRGNTVKRSENPNFRGRNVSSYNSGNGDLLGTYQSTDFVVNQLWFGAKKEADGTHGLDWGFAAEALFGTDGWVAQSWADAKFDYGWQDGDYHTAIPQLYVQLAYGDLSVKVGKFETVIGYESARAPDFAFYSHSYTFFIEPYSHSGAYFEYTPNDKLSLGAGYVMGNDASFDNTYDDHGFLGNISYQLTDKLNLSYAVMYNKNGYGNYPDSFDVDRYGLSGTNCFFNTAVVSYDISKRLNYSIQWDYCDFKARHIGGHAKMYGISNYLTYQINDKWSLGFRGEWANNNYSYGYGTDLSEYTLCLNWKPYTNISIRPEIRYDYGADKVSKAFNNGDNRDQFSGGIGAVISF